MLLLSGSHESPRIRPPHTFQGDAWHRLLGCRILREANISKSCIAHISEKTVRPTCEQQETALPASLLLLASAQCFDSVLEATPTLREALLTEAKHRLQDWLLCCITFPNAGQLLAVAAQVPQQRLEAASPAEWSAACCDVLDANAFAKAHDNNFVATIIPREDPALRHQRCNVVSKCLKQ